MKEGARAKGYKYPIRGFCEGVPGHSMQPPNHPEILSTLPGDPTRSPNPRRVIQ
jgi:hypothetical protein